MVFALDLQLTRYTIFLSELLFVYCCAIGVILTPIYLLSMLREIFYGTPNKELVDHTNLVDAEPREVYIISVTIGSDYCNWIVSKDHDRYLPVID